MEKCLFTVSEKNPISNDSMDNNNKEQYVYLTIIIFHITTYIYNLKTA